MENSILQQKKSSKNRLNILFIIEYIYMYILNFRHLPLPAPKSAFEISVPEHQECKIKYILMYYNEKEINSINLIGLGRGKCLKFNIYIYIYSIINNILSLFFDDFFCCKIEFSIR